MGFRAAALSGIRYQVYLKVFSVGLYQIGSIFLAILLSPTDFALLGLAMIFVGFADSFADFGLGSGLVQRSHVDPLAMAAGATLRLVLSIVVIGGLALSAPLIASEYSQPALRDVVWVLLPLVILNFVGFVSRVRLTKELKFRLLFIPEVIASVTTTLTSVILAVAGYSFWSLVIGYLAGAVASACSLYVLRPWKIAWRIDAKVSRELLRFGAPLVAASLLAFVFQNVGVGVLGVVDFQDVGYFLFAATWTISIAIGLHSLLDNVIFPVYAAMGGDRARISRGYLQLLRYLSWTVVPVGAFISASAPIFVISLVGNKWLPSVILIRILGISGILLVLSFTYHSVTTALGRPSGVFRYQLLGAGSMTAVAAIAVFILRESGLALAYLFVSAILLAWSLPRVGQLLDLRVADIVRTAGTPALASTLMALPVLLLSQVFTPSLGLLAAAVVVAFATYTVAMTALTHGEFIPEVRRLLGDFSRSRAD